MPKIYNVTGLHPSLPTNTLKLAEGDLRPGDSMVVQAVTPQIQRLIDQGYLSYSLPKRSAAAEEAPDQVQEDVLRKKYVEIGEEMINQRFVQYCTTANITLPTRALGVGVLVKRVAISYNTGDATARERLRQVGLL
jgi:hypothetical protein